VACSRISGSRMRSTEINVVDVDDAFVDELWKRVESSGSFYSIGDGTTKNVFRRMMFKSDLVLSIPGGYVRLDIGSDVIELHPIVFGPSAFVAAGDTLERIYALFSKLFQDKPICCIIPNEMRAAKKLALLAGMREKGPIARMLSGIRIACTAYVWRPKDV
jgi:hypothetical protein